ncbi:afadin- and alpha-actinin-binding protein B-like [Dendronephthya gigantea]|uniref:afadin- and alpha-actinin-binding protein B-like n=1 Tax=Dendronephthya gigantea TaxID=151771 RepID=UPI00106C5023|nr:afadin- and alpha-actinin-binding protein B-like [Dendronephthya gigantea]
MTSRSPDLFERYMTQSHTSPDNERFSISPDFGHRTHEKAFCTENNVEQCIAYLNQELVTLGFFSLYKNSERNGYSVVRLINNLYELLQLQIKNNQVKDELEARQRRSDCDNEFLVQSQTRLKNEFDLSQREVALLNSKQIELSKKKKSLENLVKSQKEEIKKMKGNQQHLKKQFEHDIRKVEREMVKLKEKLVQSLNYKTKEKSIGIDMLNSIQRADGKRRTWNTGNKHDEEMYRLVVNSYEDKQKELMEENNDLRELLQHTENELVNLLNKEHQDVTTDSGEEDSDEDSISVSSHTEGQYQMPFELVREGIERSIREKWKRLKEGMDSSKPEDVKKNNESNTDNDADKLKNELERYKYIVLQQEEHIQRLQDDTGAKADFLNDSVVTAEKEKVDEEIKLFKQEKKTFDEERKKFTEAAIKLGQERERFNEERAIFLKQQLLNSSPSPKNEKFRARRKSEEDEIKFPRTTTQTPVYSAAPRNNNGVERRNERIAVTTPSTEDLYSIINLRTKTEHLAEETPRRTWNQGSRSSSQNSENHEDEVIKENHLSNKKTKRIGEHAQKIKKALLKQHNNLK